MQVRVGVEMLAVLAVVLLAPSVTEGLVLKKCELRQQLNLTLLADHINEVAKIVCHAELSSHLNTTAVNQIAAPQGDHKPRFSPGSFTPFPSHLPHNESQEHNPVGNQTNHKDDPSRPGAGDRPAPGGRPGAGGPPAPGSHPGADGQKNRPSRSAPAIPKHPSENESQEYNTVGNHTGQHKDDHSHPDPSVQPNVSKSTPAAGGPPAPGGRPGAGGPPAPGGRPGAGGPPAPGGHPGADGQKNRHRRSAPGIPKPPHTKPQEHAGVGNHTGQNTSDHSHRGASPHTPRPTKPSAPIHNSPSHNYQHASPKPGVPGHPKPSAESIKPSPSKSPHPGGNPPKGNGRKSRSLNLQHNNQGFPKPSVKPIGETSHEQHGDEKWTLYGLFQLADHVACLSDKPSLNLCGLSCDKLIDDDITDDIACVETIIGNRMSTINDHRKELIKSMYDLIYQKECANVVDLPYFSSC